MNTVMDWCKEELLICTLATLIKGARHVAVGAASPIPGAAAMLSQSTADERMHITLLHSQRYNYFSDGSRELFDCAGQGRVDRFFLGGVQIDGQANINLVGIGDYPAMTRRFPGSFGCTYLYYVVPKVILFREEHSRRVLVPKVDFISAPGTSEDHVYRPGGPFALVTGLCVFLFNRNRARFALQSIHPGHSLEEIKDNTGFDFDCAEQIETTPQPGAEQLELIRGGIAKRIAESYPEFARRLFACA